jgi:hypothetical protein
MFDSQHARQWSSSSPRCSEVPSESCPPIAPSQRFVQSHFHWPESSMVVPAQGRWSETDPAGGRGTREVNPTFAKDVA